MLNDLLQSLPYTFKSLARLQEALTTPAHDNEVNYQRLEFLGDAVLDLLIAEALYKAYPTANEGRLTAMRAALVSGDAIYQRSHRLYQKWQALLTAININYQGNPKAIVDVIEALIGAAWLEGGLSAAQALVFTLIDTQDIHEVRALGEDPSLVNPKGALQAFAQKRFQTDPRYRRLQQSGPPHQPTFTCAVTVATYEATGEGHSLKEAEAMAAMKLLHTFRQNERNEITYE